MTAREDRAVAAAGYYVRTLKVAKLLWNRRARAAPICEVFGDEDAVDPRVVCDVLRIRGAIGQAMKRVFLKPPATDGISMIDIIADGLHEAAPHRWALTREAPIGPVLFECHGFTDDHVVNEETTTLPFRAARPHYNVARPGYCSDLRLTGRKRAHSAKRVRCEPEVVVENIRKEAHQR